MKKSEIKNLEEAKQKLHDAKLLIEEAKELIEPIRDSEQEKFDNKGEKAQENEAGQILQENAEKLSAALEEFDPIDSEIDTAIDNIEDVLNAN